MLVPLQEQGEDIQSQRPLLCRGYKAILSRFSAQSNSEQVDPGAMGHVPLLRALLYCSDKLNHDTGLGPRTASEDALESTKRLAEQLTLAPCNAARTRSCHSRDHRLSGPLWVKQKQKRSGLSLWGGRCCPAAMQRLCRGHPVAVAAAASWVPLQWSPKPLDGKFGS